MSGYQTTTLPNFFIRDPVARAQYDISLLQQKVRDLEINNEQLLTLSSSSTTHVKNYLQSKIDGSSAFVNSITSGLSSQGIYGAFCMYGNAFTDEQEFVGVGQAQPGGVPYTQDTPIFWASASKFLTGLAAGKCLEEGILNIYDPIWPYLQNNPTSARSISNFTGSLDYIVSVTGYAGGTAPNTWTVTTGTIDINNLAVQNLFAMNIGFQYIFTLLGIYAETAYDYPGAISSLTQFPNTIAAAQVWLSYQAYGLLNSRTLIHRDWQVWQQQDPATYISNIQSFSNVIALNKLHLFPLMFKPTNYTISSGTDIRSTFMNNADLNATTPNIVYSPVLELLGLVVDSAVQQHGYTSFSDYVTQKFFIPLAMTSSYIVNQQQLPSQVVNSLPTPQVCRDAVMANPQFESGGVYSPIKNAFGIVAPGYTGTAPTQLLPFSVYWSTETTGSLQNDSLVYTYNTQLNYYNSNDWPSGGSPLISSSRDFVQLLKLLINKGYTEFGKIQVLNSATVDFLMTPSVNNLTNLIFNRYPFDTSDGSTYTWCAGGFQKLTGISGNWQFGGQNQCSWTGLSNVSYFFDPTSGYFMVCGSPFAPLSFVDSAQSRALVTNNAIPNTPKGIDDSVCSGPFLRSKLLQCMIRP